MAEPIKRLNYFKHQFLRAKDFLDEQKYHVEMRRRHNSHLHTWGIAGDGLRVTAAQGATAVRVSPGMAVDKNGREIVLVDGATLELAGLTPGAAAYITISYGEARSDPSNETGAEGDTRWTETPSLQAALAMPSDVGTDLVLARVIRTGTTVTGVDEANRRAAGVEAGELTVRTLNLGRDNVDDSKWPRLTCSAPEQGALENGSLKLDAGREIFFTDGGQLRSNDNAHRIVFNRRADRLEFYEYGDIVFSTGGASPPERLRVGAGGNVGIGRIAAADKLEVQGNIRATALVFIDAAGALYQDNWIGMANNVEGATRWLHVGGITDGGVRRIALFADRIYAGGRLGVGVTTPDAQLHLSGGQWDVTTTEGDLKIGSAAHRLKVGVATGGVGAGDVRLRAVGGTNRLMLGSGPADTMTVVGVRVGIGTLAPGAKLEINDGDLLLKAAAEDSGDIIFQSASGAQKARIYANPAAGAGLNFAAGSNTAILSINAAGNVGIGTDAATTQLQVRKDAPGALGPVLTLLNASGVTGAGAAVDFNGYDPGANNPPTARLQSLDDGNYSSHFSFLTKASGAAANALVERLRITSGGNVGIGTGAPNRPLTIQGAGGTYMNVRGNNGGVEVLLGADNAGGIVSTMTGHDLQLRAGGNDTKVTVKANGNVGIGTTSPSAKLEVATPHSDWIFLTQQRKTEGGGGYHIHNPWGDDHGPDRNRLEIGYRTAAGADNWGLLVIQGLTGNVGIGTGNPVTRLEVAGTTKTRKLQLGDKWLLSGDGDAEANDEWLRLKNSNAPRDYYGGFAAAKLWSSGGVVQGSDVRLKKEVAPLGDAAHNLLALRGVRFKWRDAGEEASAQIGLIAHEVEQFFPELVEVGPGGMKGVNYTGLIPLLIETVKQQHSEIAELRAGLRSLEESSRARKGSTRGGADEGTVGEETVRA
ncbi:MAG TPA: tail fiber domain-containing protein [Pyrinomonadaceae bacterium]|nr:tail fiber domain-containing protein [Pyrinomonadaceae bacterium]